MTQRRVCYPILQKKDSEWSLRGTSAELEIKFCSVKSIRKVMKALSKSSTVSINNISQSLKVTILKIKIES
jgi:hypothetical protein